MSSSEDDGFKVIVPHQALADEALKAKARGWAILTKNSKDLVDDAVRFEYDVIAVEDIGPSTTRTTGLTRLFARSQALFGAVNSAPVRAISV